MAKPIITLNGLKIVNMLGMLVIILCGIRFAAEIIVPFILALFIAVILKEGANKRGNSSRLTQSFHFFMFEPIFSPVNALNQPI